MITIDEACYKVFVAPKPSGCKTPRYEDTAKIAESAGMTATQLLTKYWEWYPGFIELNKVEQAKELSLQAKKPNNGGIW